jgi:hypothetical protein
MEDKDISIHDLKLIEKELTTEELTSVLFILYAKDPRNLANINLESPNDKNYLENFAKNYNNWKTLVIEAFTIAGLFEIVNNLGISSSEAREHLRSRSSITNSIVKILYEVCELCNEETTKKFIDFIKEHCESTNLSRNQLEIYFAQCLIDKKIRLTDFNLIKIFLNSLKDDKIKEIIDRFPINDESVSDTNPDHYDTTRMKVLIINQETFYRETNSELQDLLPSKNEPLE